MCTNGWTCCICHICRQSPSWRKWSTQGNCRWLWQSAWHGRAYSHSSLQPELGRERNIWAKLTYENENVDARCFLSTHIKLVKYSWWQTLHCRSWTKYTPHPQSAPPSSSSDVDDPLANHCAILECLKAIAPKPAKPLTRPDLPPSPACRTRWEGKEPTPLVCVRVSKQPSKAPKQSK